MIIRQTSFPHIAILGIVPRTGKFRDISQDSEARTIPVYISSFFGSRLGQISFLPKKGIIIIRIEEALYFANVGQIRV